MYIKDNKIIFSGSSFGVGDYCSFQLQVEKINGTITNISGVNNIFFIEEDDGQLRMMWIEDVKNIVRW